MTENTKKILCGPDNELDNLTALGTISLMKREFAESELKYKVDMKAYDEESYLFDEEEPETLEVVFDIFNSVDDAVVLANHITFRNILEEMEKQNMDYKNAIRNYDTFTVNVLICGGNKEYIIYGRSITPTR